MQSIKGVNMSIECYFSACPNHDVHSNYCRAMFNPKYKIKSSSPKFFSDILNYTWSVTALPDVHSFEDEDENE